MSIEHVDPLHATSVTFFAADRNDDLLPRDIGFEILPMLVAGVKPNVDNLTACTTQYKPSKGAALRRFLGFSIGLSQHPSVLHPEEGFAQLAVGVRTLVLSGRPNSTLDDLITQYKSTRDEVTTLEMGMGEKPTAAQSQQMTTLLATLRNQRERLARAQKNRVGFMLEVGKATAVRVPQNRISAGSLNRQGFWVTPIYRVERKATATDDPAVVRVDMGGLIRYTG